MGILFILKNIDLNIEYIDRIWLSYSTIILIIVLCFYIILLGILLPNKARIIKNLNLITSYYFFIFIFLIKNDYMFIMVDSNLNFQQNSNIIVNFFYLIATICIFLFLLSRLFTIL